MTARFTPFLAALALLALANPATAQPELPESVEIGNGRMTVGFELKTTTVADGGERTTDHSLMEMLRPKPGYRWRNPAQRRKVERWASMSGRQLTAFFFDAYRSIVV